LIIAARFSPDCNQIFNLKNLLQWILYTIIGFSNFYRVTAYSRLFPKKKQIKIDYSIQIQFNPKLSYLIDFFLISCIIIGFNQSFSHLLLECCIYCNHDRFMASYEASYKLFLQIFPQPKYQWLVVCKQLVVRRRHSRLADICIKSPCIVNHSFSYHFVPTFSISLEKLGRFPSNEFI
jgi:hypothetical protein